MEIRYAMEYLRGIKYLGFKVALLDISRRLFNRPYKYNGLDILSNDQYYTLYLLLKSGWKVCLHSSQHGMAENDSYKVMFMGPPDVRYFRELKKYPPSRTEYGLNSADLSGKYVIDIGAYLGETIVDFSRLGAEYVVGYEPIFWKYCNENISLNNARGECRPFGAFYDSRRIGVMEETTSSGQNVGDFFIETLPFSEILNKRFDIAKIDCEGCEWAILMTPEDVLTSIPWYLVEIHGPPLPLVQRFRDFGFNSRIITKHNEFLSVWEFKLSGE